jgi:hypothetical protein
LRLDGSSDDVGELEVELGYFLEWWMRG